MYNPYFTWPMAWAYKVTIWYSQYTWMEMGSPTIPWEHKWCVFQFYLSHGVTYFLKYWYDLAPHWGVSCWMGKSNIYSVFLWEFPTFSVVVWFSHIHFHFLWWWNFVVVTYVWKGENNTMGPQHSLEWHFSQKGKQHFGSLQRSLWDLGILLSYLN